MYDTKILGYIKEQYAMLNESDKLALLEWLRIQDPHKWDYSSMGVSLRKFYSSDPRPEHHGEYDHVQKNP